MCGIVGIFGHPEAANLVYLGLYALQHRGQESAGIVASDGERLAWHRALGLVADVFDENILRQLKGRAAIGHNRYSTAGETLLRNTQPLAANYGAGALAVAHNGNLVNAIGLRKALEAEGAIFQSSVDTEAILHLAVRSNERAMANKIVAALEKVRGGYSLVFLTENELIAARDPHGFRPLILGSIKEATAIASETCAFDLIGATYEREIEPGEVFIVNNDGRHSLKPFPPAGEANCVFEYIYFARPDSLVFGRDVYEIRKALGRRLAMEQPASADLVIPVPDSGVPATLGYAEASGLPFEFGLIRNHYVKRTFIEPQERIRHFGTKAKLNAQRTILEGKRVVVVDDSIVRGTTCRKIISLVRNAGAKEVHLRISSPPIIGSCHYGVDTPKRQDLIAANAKVEDIRKSIGADSLGYLSLNGLTSVIGKKPEYDYGGCELCAACFTRRYAVPVPNEPIRNYPLRGRALTPTNNW